MCNVAEDAAGAPRLWHADSVAIAERSVTNTVQNNTSHEGLDWEEADGRAGLDWPPYMGGPGDVFPGSSGNTRFDSSTNPSSVAYSGSTSGIAISNIGKVGQNISIDVTFGTPGQCIALWGDVNRDGQIDIVDVDLIYGELLGMSTGAWMELADVDGDGQVDARDALIVHSFVEGVDVSEYRVGDVVPITIVRGLTIRNAAPVPAVIPLEKKPMTGGHR